MEPIVENVTILIRPGTEGQKTLTRWFERNWVYRDGFEGPEGVMIILEREIEEEGSDSDWRD